MDARAHFRQGLIWTAVLSMLLALLSWGIVHWELDLRIAERFYANGKWYLARRQPWRFIYHYGTWPGIGLSLAALGIWIAGRFKPGLAPWGRSCLLVVLTAVLGAGLLVNAVFKPYWGRPRPEQVQQFGGALEYRPFYSPGGAGQGNSFPSGHPTMGFIFLTLLFFRRRSRAIAYAGGAWGVLAGGLLGVTRIVQGGHFVSDIVWSLGIMLLVGTILHFFVLRVPLAAVPTAEVLKPADG